MSAEISIAKAKAGFAAAKAKAGFAALIARAEKGEQIIVTRNGRPVACLGPLPAKKPLVYGDLRGLRIAKDLSLPEEILDDFEKSGKNLAKQIEDLKWEK